MNQTTYNLNENGEKMRLKQYAIALASLLLTCNIAMAQQVASVIILMDKHITPQQITGAGSTFGGPIYAKWAENAKSQGIELNYQNIGSGGGINQVTNRTVDFGGTDMPLSAEKLTESKLVQFPTVIGGVVIIVNIPGIQANTLRLTGETLSDIYLGKITKWNDNAIKILNPMLDLPSLPIAVVYRADGSGTTYVFTNYLSGKSVEWKNTVGNSTSVKWSVGNGAKGSDGVAATVKHVKGAIGYVESAYAATNKLTTTLLKNKAGNYVEPSFAAFSAAAANADWEHVDNFAVNLNDQTGEISWPIESATFVLIPLNPVKPEIGVAVRKFFDYSFKTGSDIAKNMQYVPLPVVVQDSIRNSWSKQFSN